jgi:hypothetical protein
LTLWLLSLCRRSQAAWQLARQQHKLINTASLLEQDAQTLQRVKHANTVRLQYDQAACDKVGLAAEVALATSFYCTGHRSSDLLQPSHISMSGPLCKCKETQPPLCSCQHLLQGIAGHHSHMYSMLLPPGNRLLLLLWLSAGAALYEVGAQCSSVRQFGQH